MISDEKQKRKRKETTQLLAKAYGQAGNVDKAIAVWKSLLEDAALPKDVVNIWKQIVPLLEQVPFLLPKIIFSNQI